MNIEQSIHGTFSVIRIIDRLTIDSNLNDIAGRIEKMAGEGNVRIAIQFSTDSYLSTRSISVILRLNHFLENYQGLLAIVQPNQEIRDTLETTGLDCLLPIFESADTIR